MSLLAELKSQIKDEKSGAKTYSDLAEKADSEGFPLIAAILYSMATDEEKHETLLEEIILELEGGESEAEEDEDASGSDEGDE